MSRPISRLLNPLAASSLALATLAVATTACAPRDGVLDTAGDLRVARDGAAGAAVELRITDAWSDGSSIHYDLELDGLPMTLDLEREAHLDRLTVADADGFELASALRDEHGRGIVYGEDALAAQGASPMALDAEAAGIDPMVGMLLDRDLVSLVLPLPEGAESLADWRDGLDVVDAGTATLAGSPEARTRVKYVTTCTTTTDSQGNTTTTCTTTVVVVSD